MSGGQPAAMLVLFDIDGTLTNTFGIDGDCFVQETPRGEAG